MSNRIGTSFLNNLFFTPATLFGWGFETEKNMEKTAKIYTNVTKDVIKNADNNSKEKINNIVIFQENRKKQCNNNIKSAIKVANVVNVLGYIPLVGRLIGAVRIVAAIVTPLKGKQKAAHIIRGISEVTGYNKIRLVIDIAATAFHFAKKAFANNNSFSTYTK